MRGIIEGEAAKPAARGSIGQKVGDFYKSFIDEAASNRSARSRWPASWPRSMASATARICRPRSAAPRASARACRSTVGVGQDPRNSDAYTVLVSQSGLGMPDRDYYLRNDEKFAAIRKAYIAYITRLFTLAQRPDPGGAAERVLALETDAGQGAVGSRPQPRSQRHLQQDDPRRAAVGDAELRLERATSRRSARRASPSVIVRQPDYLTAVDAALAATPIATWKEYLAFGLLNAFADEPVLAVRRRRSSSSTAR